jgi:hypothetical protein
MPSFFNLPLNGVYPTIAAINRMDAISRLLTSLFFLCILLISMGVMRLIKKLIYSFLAPDFVFCEIGLTAVLIILLLYSLRNFALGFRRAFIVAAAIGATLGLWLPGH